MFTLGMQIEMSDSDNPAEVVGIRYHDGQQYVRIQTSNGSSWYSAETLNWLKNEKLLVA